MNKDLTVGKPDVVLWKFCLPLFGSVIFQQLYNIADSFVAGRFISENALAAVGNSYQITLIFLAFAFGCNIGCSVIVSRYFGEKRMEDMKTAVYTTLTASAVLCAVLMLLGLVLCEPILKMIRTPENIFADSALYLNIYILGLPFLLYYNVANGIFSALGDSRTPFIFLACSSTANILMDIWFVKSLHMGVSGVAWATFICQGISCILAMIVVLRRLMHISVAGRCRMFSWPIFKRIAAIAVPSILQQSSISVGNILIQKTINGFGSGIMAGYSTSVKLNNLVITSFTTIGNGVSNYTAQNLGAGRADRVKAGMKAGIKMVWLITLPIALVYLLFTGTLVKLFMDAPSAQAMKSGVEFLRILTPFYFIISIKLVIDGILRGAGQMNQFMISTFTDLLLRVVLAIVLSGMFGAVGIWSAWPVGWTIGMGMSAVFYKKGAWQHTASQNETAV